MIYHVKNRIVHPENNRVLEVNEALDDAFLDYSTQSYFQRRLQDGDLIIFEDTKQTNKKDK